MMMPKETPMKTFWQVKTILRNYEAKSVVRISLCPNDCIAYWDSTHLPIRYRHSHRTRCPVCGTPRDVIDPADGKKKPAKVMFFFPLAPYVRSLYARPHLVPYLRQDCADPPPPEGHIRRSRGWKEKVMVSR